MVAYGVSQRRLVPMLNATPYRSTAATVASAYSREAAISFSA